MDFKFILGTMVRNRYIIIGCLFLLLGYLYYLLVRGQDPLGVWKNLPQYTNPSSIFYWGGWPSLLHTAAFSFISYGIVNRAKYLIVAFWVITNILFETTQGPWGLAGLYSPGAFALHDLIASIVGGGIFLLVVSKLDTQGDNSCKHSMFSQKILRSIGLTSVISFGFVSITASYCPEGDDCIHEISNAASPVYLSYEELRGPLTIQIDRVLINPGKIYLYQDYLFVNEPNEGIHVYDNSNPDNPITKGFIVLPGNIDIAIRDGYLYADSFTDLVVIDLSIIETPTVVKRIENIFPYDEYQAIDADIYFPDIDETQGVVVGYKAEGEGDV